jgi:N-acetylmuramoyl-L-alanine amidase
MSFYQARLSTARWLTRAVCATLAVAAATAHPAFAAVVLPRPPAARLTELAWIRSDDKGWLRLTLDRPVSPRIILLSSPWRLVIDLPGTLIRPALTVPPVTFAGVQGVRAGQFQSDCARVVIDLTRPVTGRLLADPGGQIVVELDAPEARGTIQAREIHHRGGAVGRAVVRIDPGHCGGDVGSLGPCSSGGGD